MALATRELTVTYGGYTISTANNRELTNIIINTKRFEEATVEFTWDISSTTEAGFATEITTTEDAFRKPFQSLTITQGSSTLYSFSQSGNTGLDADPEITKREDNATGRSRRYTAMITVGLPANTGAETVSGLREHSVDVTYASNRVRTITISGVFTAVSGNNARDQYESQISSLENSVFNALDISVSDREVIDEPESTSSYNIKTISFRRVWRELIFRQAGGSKDNAKIINQRLSITRRTEAPGDTPGVDRLATLDVEYDCDVDGEVTTDLKSLYQGTIRPFMLQQTKKFVPGSTIALIKEEPQIRPDVNHIHVVMEIKATLDGSVFARIVEIEDELQPGAVLVPIWVDDMTTRYRYQGPIMRRRTITDTKTVRGFVYTSPTEMKDAGRSILNDHGAGLGAIGLSPPAGMSSIHRSSRPQYIHKLMGLGSNFIDVTDIVTTDVFEFYTPYVGGTSMTETGS